MIDTIIETIDFISMDGLDTLKNAKKIWTVYVSILDFIFMIFGW